ncbi:MAG: RodZ domain-containing protein [Betaproteobacteria bacterium]
MNDEPTPESPSGPPTRPSVDVEPLPPMASATGLDPDPETPSQFAPTTAGGVIRAARQAQGIDISSLAAMLKIPLRRMDALEMGRHAELQGPTFERALAQAACRVLKVDPKPVLALLPQHEGNTLERVSEGINTPFRERQGGSTLGELPAGFKPVAAVIVALLVAALAMFFVPNGWWGRVTHSVLSSVPASAPAEAASAPDAAPTGSISTPVELPLAASAAAPTPAAPSTAPAASAALAAPLSAAAVSATAAQGIDEVLAHVAGAPNIPLQVTATADSWVEVLDAQGHSLMSRTVVAGESVGLDGALPMKVKIGNAKATHLKLRGDNVDLTPFTHDNVARLELK